MSRVREAYNLGMTDQPTTVIVGAGFAGLSTAYHLSLTTDRSIVVLERASRLGAHASGRNAGLLMQGLASTTWRQLIIASRRALVPHAASIGLQPTGSWLLGPTELLETLRDPAVPSRLLSAESCREQHPLLRGSRFEAALETPSDAVIDPLRLLDFYARGGRRIDVRLEARVRSIEVQPRPPRFRLITDQGDVHADVLVNAAGAWANELAHLAGTSPLPLTSFKRHLFHFRVSQPTVPTPFVWDQQRNFYFRAANEEDWLFCICDERPQEDLQETVDDSLRADVECVRRLDLPQLEDATETSAWSCFRTKSSDGDPIVGWDPETAGMFWVAGLGGSGMGASWEIGRQAAELLRRHSEGTPSDAVSSLAPRRFL
jgi:D-arginine dehydrogenase